MTAGNREQADFRGPLDVTRAATAVIDAHDTVIGWSPAAERLLGYAPGEIVGRPVATFLAPGATSSGPPLRFQGNEIRVARHRDGHDVVVATGVCTLPGAGPAVRVLVAAELTALRQWEARLALLHGLATQSPVGLGIYDTDLRLTWCNTAYEREIGRPFDEFRGLRADELYSDGKFVTRGHPPTLEAVMRHVLDTGEPFLDLHFQGRPPSDPDTEHLWSCAYYRLQDADGRVIGVCEDAFDISDRYKAQRRLALLVEAGRQVGGALDVQVTAEKITEVAVPEFAAEVTVDLAQAVLDGEVPATSGAAAASLVRVARCCPGERAHESGGPSPVRYPPGSPQDRSLSSGGLVLDESELVVPLRAGNSVLGLVTFLRGTGGAAFDSGEVALADELVARTAVSIDNARRFTRERTASLALQRQLLPQQLPEQSAVDLAHRYLPTDDVTGVGGDWFDVIPLSGTRVGLVVGDVVGHGLQAAATMGRLRTTVRAFAQLDMDPVELLARLDDLVAQSAEEQWGGPLAAGGAYADVTTGATCLYAVYDPVSRRCVMARAGHLPPAVVDPDGRVSFPELPAGPPLGLGGLPFESMEIELPVGSLLALFTDGLVEARDRDIDHGLDTLGRVLGDRDASLEELCDRAVAELLPSGSTADDTALLLVRTRELDASRVGEWELPADPVAPGRARELATRQLHAWGLEELSFATELVVSELVTNAVRYGGGPIQVRLIRDRTLLCEVADTGHTSPHLRHSTEEDEGGRGLLIVAQLVQRWGTRYTHSGKTIWTEQTFPASN
ncbi:MULTISPECIES: SpoIIE family protein phosphatase [unclassified Streptomyces]|uniref:SpoIIE family protein phosphatase n=1 Tax=unclassified Streptomyces TaxID=2593676 RepID=UPI00136837BE|nr:MULTISPECIES: SpoIIE family protein phosphatase [unclassified Streptomyces]MYY86266.1 SpoIIE family protein phosphatase [Streptomyces sp. SID335]MYZ18508.1 SpoIIE family protein phosphatase [Streptomyces sp. SID337]NDZ84364.1 SpoIIE family protein phosphatase [Streptomyces sp. SID10115]NEB44823.1 SpoIIE family protein phosphatase [Streptomyces sp. SID339]